MGNVLDAPITAKDTEAGSGLGMRYAVSSMQGWRREMEDAHVAAIGLPGKPDCSFFGVFDGHGGSTVARTTAEKIVQTLAATPQYVEAVDPTEWSRVFYSSIFRLDRALRTLMFHFGERSGSTAIMSLVTPTHLIVGNVGDSRCVMGRAGTTIPMSEDHKPTKMGERRRIKRAGGTVAMARVNGELAVSRALGDFSFKARKDLPPDAQQVTCAPEIRVMPRHPSDEFLLLCCDGIWDVMTSDEAVRFVRNELTQHPNNPTGVMNNLINTCLQRGSRDNMTAMVVIFSHTAPPVMAAGSASAPSTAILRAVTPDNGGGAQNGLPHVQGGSPRVMAFQTPATRSRRAGLADGSNDVMGSAPMRLNSSTAFAQQQGNGGAPAANTKLFHSSPTPLTASMTRDSARATSPATARPSIFMPDSGRLRMLAVRSAGASPKRTGMPSLVGGQRQDPRRVGAKRGVRSRPGSSAHRSPGGRYGAGPSVRNTGGSRRGARDPRQMGGTMQAFGQFQGGMTVTGGGLSATGTPMLQHHTYHTSGGGVVDVTVSDLADVSGRPAFADTTGVAPRAAGGGDGIMFGPGAARRANGGRGSRPGSKAGGREGQPRRLSQTRALYSVDNGPRSIRSRQASRQTSRQASRHRAHRSPARSTSGWARDNAGAGMGVLAAAPNVTSSYPGPPGHAHGAGGRRPPRLKHLSVGNRLSDHGRELLAATLTPAELRGLMSDGSAASPGGFGVGVRGSTIRGHGQAGRGSAKRKARKHGAKRGNRFHR